MIIISLLERKDPPKNEEEAIIADKTMLRFFDTVLATCLLSTTFGDQLHRVLDVREQMVLDAEKKIVEKFAQIDSQGINSLCPDISGTERRSLEIMITKS